MHRLQSLTRLYQHAPIACRYIVWIVLCVHAWTASFAGDSKSTFPIELNVRLVWGGPRPLNYSGAIEIDDGKIVCSQQLGIDPFDAGFLVADSNGKFAFDDSQTRFGGCDLRVLAKSTSRLKLVLNVVDARNHQATVKEFSWPISELRDSASTETIEVGDCRVSIDRVPGDRLRAITNRSHLIFNSEEPLGFQLQPYALPWTNVLAHVEWTLVRAEDGQEIANQTRTVSLDEQGNADPLVVPFSAPKEEGVYELHCKIEPKRMLPGIILRHPMFERSIQLVVYNSSPIQQSGLTRGTLANTMSATQGWQAIATPVASAFAAESLTHHLLESGGTARRYPFIDMAKSLSRVRKETSNTLGSSNQNSNLSMPANSIASTQCQGLVPNEMHRLTIRSTSKDASLRVVIQGQSSPRDRKGSESTWVNDVFEVSPRRSLQRSLTSSNELSPESFEVLFWPNTRNGHVEITNLSSANSLEVVNVQIDRWIPLTLSPKTGDPKSKSHSLSTLELHSPNVRSAFGQPFKSSGPKQNHYDDWRQFLHFAESTATYCNANGIERLAMVVASEGGTLFPSTKIGGNARFDTGTFSNDGRDVLRKDVVELLYRVMARHSIVFVPMLELNGPLRDLSEPGPKQDEVELWQDRNSGSATNDLPPRLYNPLSYRVQRSIAAVLDEFQSRYHSNPHYSGIAIRVDSPSHLCVDYDVSQTNPAILERFAGEVGGNIPRDPSQRDSFIVQHANAMYQQWLQSASMTFLSKLKNKPNWVSFANRKDKNFTSTESMNSLTLVTPLMVDSDMPDAHGAICSILGHWNTESPTPIHLGMEHPEPRIDADLGELCRMTSPFYSEFARSIPQRDAANSLSKVRVWIADENCSAMLISNSGAISEKVNIVWQSLPKRFRVSTTWERQFSEASGAIAEMEATAEWAISIPAGQAMVVSFDEGATTAQREQVIPLHWVSQDSTLIRSLDTALQSLEQAINRLSIPQPRADFSTNPSFESESPHARGRFAGWTSSLDPHAAVSLDTTVSANGRNSIKFKSEKQSSVAWLQSDPFAVSLTDRLFVGFQAFSDRVPEQVTVTLWRFDAKSERFESIASRAVANRLSQPKESANWTNIGFDLTDEIKDRFEHGEPMLCRLQIETKGEGTLWLDDVFISTEYLREIERRDLRSELFLARSSLKSGDTGPANAMLNSPRGRLVRWNDESYSTRLKYVSIESMDRSNKSLTTSPAKTLPPSAPSSGNQDKSEGKPRLKRSKYFWWQRKE